MILEQKIWTEKTGWSPSTNTELGSKAQVVFVFGAREVLKKEQLLNEITMQYPGAFLFGCSSSGEIIGSQLSDESLVLTAVHFQHTTIKKVSAEISDMEESHKSGEELARQLLSDDLKHVFVLSEGLKVNGSELVKGFMNVLPSNVSVTGGLSGDGYLFKETIVIGNGHAKTGCISALGFYGDKIRVGFGSKGGWDPFGPYRLITNSKGNILYEMDGKPAVDLYKKYMGKYADDFLASGLLFPLMLKDREGKETGVVRSFLSVNEDQSIVFAGDVPQGAYARLMKANFDRLVDGAIGAAEISNINESNPPALAILVSCVGRKKVLNQRTEEELEGVQEVLGDSTVMTGFYSYGEICPFKPGEKSLLHNQTMTITTFWES